MTDPNYTDIVMLLDRSGSMRSLRDDMIGGFDEFIRTQRDEPGRCTVSLFQFDTHFDTVYQGLSVHDVPSLVLEPRGSTALLDAIGRVVHDTGARLAALPEAERPGTVIVGIITDGHENASHRYSNRDIREMLDHQERMYDWTFLYLGANQDAIEVGRSLGVAAERSLTYGGDKVADAMKAYGSRVSRMKQSRREGKSVDEARRDAAYTTDERTQSV